MNPLISIVIPLYNKGKHIKSTLETIISQDYSNFEVIVINDGSTDDSESRARSVSDNRIRIITTENQGVSKARNSGISESKGEFVAFMDADDSWDTDHLSNLVGLYQKFPEAGLFATAYKKKRGKRFLKTEFHGIPDDPGYRAIIDDYFKACYWNAITWTSAVMVPKRTFEAVGVFDETITYGAGEDTDLWMRIALKFPVAFSGKRTATHHLDAENRISNTYTNIRNFMDLDKYEEAAQTNPSLKKFLDLNRFSIGIQYQSVGNYEKAREYFEKIDLANLNRKQKFLMGCSQTTLNNLKSIQVFLQDQNLFLSAFK